MSLSALIDRAQDAHVAAVLRRGVSTAELVAASGADRERLSRLRGRANERRVLDALAAAVLPNWIVGIRAGGPTEDRAGADIVVTCDDHHRYPIQVKSCVDSARRFIAHGRRRGVGPIGMVVVNDGVTDRQIVGRVLAALVEMRALRAGRHP